MNSKCIALVICLILIPIFVQAQYIIEDSLETKNWIICHSERSEGSSSFHFRFRTGHKQKSDTSEWWAQDKGRHLIGSMISTVFIGKLSQVISGYSTEKSQLTGGGITLTGPITIGIPIAISLSFQRNIQSLKECEYAFS